jgi:pyruvate/2-oxoglutarate dehydrogenase complex dihydrolipoamide dehydrogenase (E3) component
MSERLRPDLCIIGAGAGGLTAAAAAAMLGVPVVLIEKNRMGGECLNAGCVPSSALIAAAHRAHRARMAVDFGIAASPTIDFDKVRAHVQSVIASIAPHDSRERFEGLGVRVINAAARFVDPATVVAGDVEVRARRFIVATGSAPDIPPFPGLGQTPFLTNDSIFALATLPEHLVVIGAGSVGLVLAQAFRRLGSQVSVIDAGRPLAKDDPECVDIVLEALAAEGIALHDGAIVTGIRGDGARVEVGITRNGGARAVSGSHLLIATGRRPNVTGLGLDRAGIAFDASGIKVDAGLRTTNRRVYAIGDVNGGMLFSNVAQDQAGLVLRNALFRMPVNARRRVVPWVTRTEPELAHVGRTEAQARAKGFRVRVLRAAFADNDLARAERATRGRIKVVTTSRGRILGATIVGPGAGELIAMWSLAISRGLRIGAVAGALMPYPSLVEISRKAAVGYFIPGLTGPLARRIIGFLRRFG